METLSGAKPPCRVVWCHKTPIVWLGNGDWKQWVSPISFTFPIEGGGGRREGRKEEEEKGKRRREKKEKEERKKEKKREKEKEEGERKRRQNK